MPALSSVRTPHPDHPRAVAVQRWQRWGHDRALVSVDGQELGYRDLACGGCVVHGEPTRDVVELIARSTADLYQRVALARLRAEHAAARAARVDPDAGYHARHSVEEPLADVLPFRPAAAPADLARAVSS